jgi:hypothetical protein
MPNRQQRAGTDWEETCAADARAAGFPKAERIRVKHPDRGDIGHVPAWTLECKSPGPPTVHTHDTAWQAFRPKLAAGATLADAFLAGYLAGQKHGVRFDLAAAMDQAGKAQAQNGTPYAAVLRKRPRAVSARGYAIMEASQFWAIARRLDELGGA